ncbi:MAG TPA: hypothetical protein VNO20_03535 [Solirubrobacterales bacterium]|nr:hypothetical protein [Solirubrobacterales bacterium]
MPGTTTITISSEQRLGIYTVVRNHLGGLNDVGRTGDAKQLRRTAATG